MTETLEREHTKTPPTQELLERTKGRIAKGKGYQLYERIADVYIDLTKTPNEHTLNCCLAYHYSWGVSCKTERGNGHGGLRVEQDEDTKTNRDMWATLLREVHSGYLQQIVRLAERLPEHKIDIHRMRQDLHNAEGGIERALTEVSKVLSDIRCVRQRP